MAGKHRIKESGLLGKAKHSWEGKGGKGVHDPHALTQVGGVGREAIITFGRPLNKQKKRFTRNQGLDIHG